MAETNSYYWQAYNEFRLFCTGMPDFDFKPAQSALVVIDMQRAMADRNGALGRRMQALGLLALYDNYFRQVDSVVRRITALRAAAEQIGVEVIFTYVEPLLPDGRDLSPILKHYGLLTGPAADEVAPLAALTPKAGEVIIPRPTISLFTTPTAPATLRNMGIDTLYLTGVLTNVSIESTARDASDGNFKVAIVSDACTALTAEDHQQGLETLGLYFTFVLPTEELLWRFQQKRATMAVWGRSL